MERMKLLRKNVMRARIVRESIVVEVDIVTLLALGVVVQEE